MVALLKGTDKDRSNPRSYRPISLLSGLEKLLVQMMVRRLMSCMNERWNDRQYGFVTGKCTEDAWERMKTDVYGSRSKYVMCVWISKERLTTWYGRLCLKGCVSVDIRM